MLYENGGFMQDIFVKVEENTIGPLSAKKIRHLIEVGVFSAEDFVWSKSNGEWVPAGSVSLLRPFFYSSQEK